MDISHIKKQLDEHTRENETRFKEMTESQNILLGLHAETREQVKAIDKKLDDLNGKFDEFFTFIKALGTGKKVLLGTAVVIGAIVGIISGLRFLFGAWK